MTLCGLRTSQPLWKTFVCPADPKGDDTMVHGPMERTAAHFCKKDELKRGKNDIMRLEGPML